MHDINQTPAQKIAHAASALHHTRTGHLPKGVNVVLNGDVLVVTLHEALSPAEKALVQSAGGAAKVQEFHRQLFASSLEPLRQEIKRITGVEVSQATAELESSNGAATQMFTSGTIVQVFQLANCVPGDTWSGNVPNRQS